jgi:hypothetical protein
MWLECSITHSMATFIGPLDVIVTAFGHCVKKKSPVRRRNFGREKKQAKKEAKK